MNIEQLKSLLRHHNIKPNFTYGQNFLIDDIILEDIVDAAGVTSDDVVLEIGPGIGNLTEKLCQRANFVLSIEKDDKFFPILKAIKKDHKENFRFEIGDALEFDFYKILSQSETAVHSDNSDAIRGLGSNYKVVANIPYYITGKILKMLMAAEHKPTSITILTQKEVAQNIIAKPGNLSVLAISVQLYGEPKIIQIVPAKSFHPAPKVDSAILQINAISNGPFKDLAEEKNFFRVVKACFTGKRKQLHNTLVNNLRLPKELVETILKELKISPAARPQELSIKQWRELAEKVI